MAAHHDENFGFLIHQSLITNLEIPNTLVPRTSNNNIVHCLIVPQEP